MNDLRIVESQSAETALCCSSIADEVFVPKGRAVVILSSVDFDDEPAIDDEIDDPDAGDANLTLQLQPQHVQAKAQQRFQAAVGV